MDNGQDLARTRLAPRTINTTRPRRGLSPKKIGDKSTGVLAPLSRLSLALAF